jgi:hypothetical protein
MIFYFMLTVILSSLLLLILLLTVIIVLAKVKYVRIFIVNIFPCIYILAPRTMW